MKLLSKHDIYFSDTMCFGFQISMNAQSWIQRCLFARTASASTRKAHISVCVCQDLSTPPSRTTVCPKDRMQPARARSDQQGAQDTIKTLLFNQGPYTLHCIKQTPKLNLKKVLLEMKSLMCYLMVSMRELYKICVLLVYVSLLFYCIRK